MKSPLPPSPAFAADDVDLKLVHPSLGALLAWRYAQLLTVLPRRATGARGVVGLAAWCAIERVLECLRARTSTQQTPFAVAEAAGWERLARALHEEAPTGGLGAAPETVFGSLDALTVSQIFVFFSLCLHWLMSLGLRLRVGSGLGVQRCVVLVAPCPRCRLPLPPPAGQGPSWAGRGSGPDVPTRAALPAVAVTCRWKFQQNDPTRARTADLLRVRQAL